jgi:AP-1 complex subunit gamma-1
MLGYPTSFIQMTCVNLLASGKFSDKRIAYVALCVLMDERSEVLLLTSHTIKKDLESTNQYIVAIALNAIGEVCTSDMCRDTCPEVVKLLSNNNPFIKKKAALACSKIIRKCPELIDTIADKLNLVFEDKNHGVLLCGLNLAIQVFKIEPTYIEKYKKYLNPMIRYLKNLSSTNYAPEYDIHGVTDPFLQVKILEVLQYYGRNNAEASEEMNDLLASVKICNLDFN